MKKYESSRVKCGRAIEKMGDLYKDLVHITSDGDDFTKKNRSRHFDVGIAEQNLINVATGFALKSHRVIVNGISSFVLYNAYMQIRNNLCYQNLPVTILGIGSGMSYGHLGFSHHSLEDISAMYALPNMKIYLPCDANEAALAIEDSLRRGGPSYIRVRTGMEPVVYKNRQLRTLTFDKPILLKQGKDVLIVSFGATIYHSILAAKSLINKGINVGVLNINSLGIYNPDTISKFLRGHKLLVVVEEHYEHNGLGSILINQICGKINTPFLELGVRKEFVKTGGSGDELLAGCGIDSANIETKILNFFKHHE